MSQNREKLLPAWSPKKRIMVTAVISGGILVAALIIGGGLYQIGSYFNLFKSQSIKSIIKQELESDPEFIAAVKHAQTKKECRNDSQGFSYFYGEELILDTSEAVNPCSTFRVSTNPSSETAPIKIKSYGASKSTTIDQLAFFVDKLNVGTVHHDHYQTSLLIGEKDGLPYQAYLVEKDPRTTWTLEYYPANPGSEDAVRELVSSVRFNLNSKF